jgi:hypothetical protein
MARRSTSRPDHEDADLPIEFGHEQGADADNPVPLQDPGSQAPLDSVGELAEAVGLAMGEALRLHADNRTSLPPIPVGDRVKICFQQERPYCNGEVIAVGAVGITVATDSYPVRYRTVPWSAIADVTHGEEW